MQGLSHARFTAAFTSTHRLTNWSAECLKKQGRQFIIPNLDSTITFRPAVESFGDAGGLRHRIQQNFRRHRLDGGARIILIIKTVGIRDG